MTTVLIQATTTTPEIALEAIEACISFVDIDHMRFLIDQCSTQLGHIACNHAYIALEAMEDTLNQS